MKIYNHPSKAAARRLAAIVNRGLSFRKKDYQAVSRILEDVRRNGDDAVLKYARRFDAPDLSVGSMKVGNREMAAAAKKVDRTFRRALKRAASQIETFHRRQLRQSWIDTGRPAFCWDSWSAPWMQPVFMCPAPEAVRRLWCPPF